MSMTLKTSKEVKRQIIIIIITNSRKPTMFCSTLLTGEIYPKLFTLDLFDQVEKDLYKSQARQHISIIQNCL